MTGEVLVELPKETQKYVVWSRLESKKMSEGWFAILDIPDYIEKYTRILNFDI
jgi:hypothetical protein